MSGSENLAQNTLNQVLTTNTTTVPVNYNTTTSTYVNPVATTYTSTSPQYVANQAYNAVVGTTGAYGSAVYSGEKHVAEELPVESRI